MIGWNVHAGTALSVGDWDRSRRRGFPATLAAALRSLPALSAATLAGAEKRVAHRSQI